MGPAGAAGAPGPTGATGPAFPGYTQANPVASCAAAQAGGLTRSGLVWITLGGNTYQTYCDQETNGGGWALVFNSVLGVNTLEFWQIPYAQRLQRFGRPSLDSNYYDGAIYSAAASMEHMDVIEDWRGDAVAAFVATSAGFDSATMTFVAPSLVSGNGTIYACQFAAGWSSSDFDGDTNGSGNCATAYSNVTQHYCQCWNYNLGSDADASGGSIADGSTGPHVATGTLGVLGLAGDGSQYSRVRRISRFAKW
jgi:hypothetical protein